MKYWRIALKTTNPPKKLPAKISGHTVYIYCENVYVIYHLLQVLFTRLAHTCIIVMCVW